MLPAGLVLLVVLVATLTAVWLLQRRLIYFPDAAVRAAGSVLPGAQEITLRTDDGLALGAWHVAPTRADLGITVLVMPGNAGSRAARAPLARRLAAKGFAVLLLDYRGYGGNPGSPSEGGLIKDARAARAYLLNNGVPAQRLIYFGESLGAAVATRLAAQHPPGGLVLRSPGPGADRGHLRLRRHDRAAGAERGGSGRCGRPRAGGRSGRADHNDAALLEGNELVAAVFDLALIVRSSAGRADADED